MYFVGLIYCDNRLCAQSLLTLQSNSWTPGLDKDLRGILFGLLQKKGLLYFISNASFMQRILNLFNTFYFNFFA
jgi:hypothetical protein